MPDVHPNSEVQRRDGDLVTARLGDVTLTDCVLAFLAVVCIAVALGFGWPLRQRKIAAPAPSPATTPSPGRGNTTTPQVDTTGRVQQ